MPFTPCMFDSTRPVSAKKRDREKDAAKAETRLDSTRLCLSVCLSHSFSLSLTLPRHKNRGLSNSTRGGVARTWLCRAVVERAGRGGRGRGRGKGRREGGVVYLPCCWTDRRGGGDCLTRWPGCCLLAALVHSVPPTHSGQPRASAENRTNEPQSDAQIRVRLTKHQRIEISEKRETETETETERKKTLFFFLVVHHLSYLILSAGITNPNPPALARALSWGAVLRERVSRANENGL